MSKLDVFGRSRIVLPVIHVESLEQTERNIEICKTAGADGAFLISHKIDDDELLEIAQTVRKNHLQYWLGINCLSMSDKDALLNCSFMKGVWTDNALAPDDHEAWAVEMKSYMARNPAIYFGGVDFKHQPPSTDLKRDCELAKTFADVVTTSGSRTASAPDLAKMISMREYLGDHPLAIASGIDLNNITQFLPYVDCYLVSSGISFSWAELDIDKVKRLVDLVHAYKG